MSTPARTVKRRTMLPHHGRQVVLIIPPYCDVISVRLAGTRTVYDVSLAAVYDMAVKQHAAAKKRGK